MVFVERKLSMLVHFDVETLNKHDRYTEDNGLNDLNLYSVLYRCSVCIRQWCFRLTSLIGLFIYIFLISFLKVCRGCSTLAFTMPAPLPPMLPS